MSTQNGRLKLAEKNSRVSHEKPSGWEARIVLKTSFMDGVPLIKGSDIPVFRILEKLSCRYTTADIRKEYPELKDGDVEAALACAASAFGGNWLDEEKKEPEKREEA